MRKWSLVVCIVSALCFGCSGESNTNDVAETPADVTATDWSAELVADVVEPGEIVPEVIEPAPTYSFATFNVGLVKGYVPLAEERLPFLLDAIPTIDADFVCLQEVWELEDVDAVKEATKEIFPHVHFVDTTATAEETEPACTSEETDPLLACVNEFCADTDDLTGCVMDNCVEPFTAVSKPCSNCLVANIAKPVEEIIDTCLNSSASFTSEGRNGLMLLSKHAFASTDHTVLDSFIVRRAVLHGRVELESGPVNLLCTHLSAALSEVEYGGEFASWEEEQAKQTEGVIAFADEQAGEEPAMILGDMNCGPEAANDIEADYAENFALFAAGGYEPIYLDQGEDVVCSWCAMNPLSDTGKNRLIDHLFAKNFGDYQDLLVVERIMDSPITVTHPDSGEEVETYLSDHFGMRAVLP